MLSLFPDERRDGSNALLGGFSALTYDALNTAIIAIKNSTVNNPKPVHVALQIGMLKGDHGVNGESGFIDFDNPQKPGIPKDKFIAILRVANRNTPTLAITCGKFENKIPEKWCPSTGDPS
jgi:hypothetical protein